MHSSSTKGIIKKEEKNWKKKKNWRKQEKTKWRKINEVKVELDNKF
jgi:hypothetical protein